MGSNAEAAELLREIADLLDLVGERFKPEAYRRAARSLDTLSEELAAVAARGALREVPGVGEAIAEKLGEYLASGRIAYLDRLRAETPPGLAELMRLPGLGPKTTRRFWTELGVTGRGDLAAAVDAGRLDGMKGFGVKKVGQIRTALEAAERGPTPGRRPIESVYVLARSIRETLLRSAPTQQVEVAGSFRRGRETVGDLDVLVTSDRPEAVFDVFSALPEVAEVRLRGGTKETVVLRGGLQVDLRVVEPGAFGAALQYFTGSKDHNVRLRSLARDLGLKINEYGVYRDEERVGGRTEEEVYARLGLAWIPPELREDLGEIEAARTGRLPRLVAASDLVGDLHVHLDPAAGTEGLVQLRERAAALGLRYVGVVTVEPGPDGRPVELPEAIRRELANPVRGGLRIVPVEEVDDAALRPAPDRSAAGYRVLRAPRTDLAPARGSPDPKVRLFAHLSPDPVEAARSLALARALGAAVEIGPGPGRIDSSLARTALGLGVGLAVPTGISEPDGAATREVALGFARRAAATKERIANARPLPDEGPEGPGTGRQRTRAK